MTIEIANVEQTAAWDGHEGDVWTEHADRYDRAGHRIWERVLGAGVVGTADRVVDIGCGTGSATRDIARLANDGWVTGIDLSTRMLELARSRSTADGLANITFVRGDAQVHPFVPGTFDVAISSFGAMFFNDPVAAFTNIAGAMVDGGALTLLAWRALEENDWLMALRHALALGRELPTPPPDAPTPFALADPERVRGILGAAGFDDIELVPIDEAMELGSSAADALDFAKTMGIFEGLTQGLDETSREQAVANLAEVFAAHQTDAGVLLGSAAWCIEARKR